MTGIVFQRRCRRYLAAVACLTLLLAGCDRSNPVAGSWEGIALTIDGRVQNRVEFHRDGSYDWKFVYTDFNRRTGQFTFSKFNRLTTEVTGDYRIVDGELLLVPGTEKNMIRGREIDIPPNHVGYEFAYPFRFEDGDLVLEVEDNVQIRLEKKGLGLF